MPLEKQQRPWVHLNPWPLWPMRFRPLVPIEPAVGDAYAVTHAQPVGRVLLEGGGAAVAHLDHDAIAFVARAALLDLVAGDAPADHAGDGGRVVATATADLVAEHATHDRARDRACAGRSARAAHDLDRDDTAVVGVRDIAVGRRRRVIAWRLRVTRVAVVVGVRVGRATREGCERREARKRTDGFHGRLLMPSAGTLP